ncbi:hypothetical protein GQ44DRAFT_702671 [Phaeosphaeriaceae sp. PMI808]|nr:hypothetical protein GQ44DRAFT_702671 [Phaeosphaeriaceae sp. PMI808]
MPVTIRPSPDKVGRNSDATVSSEVTLYNELVKGWENDGIGYPMVSGSSSKAGKPVLHSSFSGFDTMGLGLIVPYRNGFVQGVIRAFQQDLHLKIRPDDVWLAIVTQFSFYVNKHAEALRKHFVNHDGKLELSAGDLTKPFFESDVAALAQQFPPLMKEKMVDPDVTDWLLPIFTTTTDNDLAVTSMVMMATMKEYFKYVMVCGCGFPSVTLLGEASDWQMILERLEKLAEYGDEPAAWSRLLTIVIKRFIATFYLPESPELKQFWMQAIHAVGALGSGTSSPYNGWLTAFMYWDSHGNQIKSYHKVDMNGVPPLELDGEVFPLIPYQREGIPSGVVEVPVTVKALDLGLQLETTIVAGSMGVFVTEGQQEDSGSTVQPCSGWWMLEDSRVPL